MELSEITLHLKDHVCKLEEEVKSLRQATSTNGRVIRKVELKLDARSKKNDDRDKKLNYGQFEKVNVGRDVRSRVQVRNLRNEDSN